MLMLSMCVCVCLCAGAAFVSATQPSGEEQLLHRVRLFCVPVSWLSRCFVSDCGVCAGFLHRTHRRLDGHEQRQEGRRPEADAAKARLSHRQGRRRRPQRLRAYRCVFCVSVVVAGDCSPACASWGVCVLCCTDIFQDEAFPDFIAEEENIEKFIASIENMDE